MIAAPTGANIFASAAAAARAAAELENDSRKTAGAKVAGTGDEPGGNPNADAEARLAAVLEVNRTLHTCLARKQQLLTASKKDVAVLEARLAGRAIEEPLRKSTIEELQNAAHASGQNRVSRDSVMLDREIGKLEIKIESLNGKNLELADRHRQERARLVDHQARLRTLYKRERELAKHLDFLAEKLTEASANACGFGGSCEGGKPRDFRNLPGFCLSKLLGPLQQQPPSVVVTEKASPPALEAEQNIVVHIPEGTAEQTVADDSTLEGQPATN